MDGNFSAPKNSGPLKCSSRCRSPVLTPETSILASTRLRQGSPGACWRSALEPLKEPWTLENIKCFTVKRILECSGTRVQFERLTSGTLHPDFSHLNSFSLRGKIVILATCKILLKIVNWCFERDFCMESRSCSGLFFSRHGLRLMFGTVICFISRQF